MTQSGNTLDFTATLFNNNKFINTGFPLTFAYNLTPSPTVTYTNLTAGWGIPDVLAGNQQAPNTYHQDGTGDFQYGVLWGLQGGGSGTSGPLHFDITAAGLTLASLAQNALGMFFAVDIISGTNGNTGNVDASTRVSAVPLPPALLLFGTALVGLGVLGRRRKQGSAAQAI